MNNCRFKTRQLCRFVLSGITREIDYKNPSRAAAVFAPHPDDETLGCGGTIFKKRKAGAKVKIFFMTDGGKSHPNLISAEKLKRIRENEALRAGQMLRLDASDMSFLQYESRKLCDYTNSAIKKVQDILLLQQPDEIFIPYKREPNRDHSATNKIVLSALKLCKRKTTVYEYPVWLYFCLPWVSMKASSAKGALSVLKQSIISELSMLKDFRHHVYIGDILEIKHDVLNQHKSQMTRLASNPRWHTLGDLSNGDFLECFFQEYEIFHMWEYVPKRKPNSIEMHRH